STAGMEGEERDAEFGRGLDRLGDGVGDVVVLEVEEDVVAAITQLSDDVRAAAGEERRSDLVEGDGVTETIHQGERVLPRGQIERDDQSSHIVTGASQAQSARRRRSVPECE